MFTLNFLLNLKLKQSSVKWPQAIDLGKCLGNFERVAMVQFRINEDQIHVSYILHCESLPWSRKLRNIFNHSESARLYNRSSIDIYYWSC